VQVPGRKPSILLVAHILRAIRSEDSCIANPISALNDALLHGCPWREGVETDRMEPRAHAQIARGPDTTTVQGKHARHALPASPTARLPCQATTRDSIVRSKQRRLGRCRETPQMYQNMWEEIP